MLANADLTQSMTEEDYDRLMSRYSHEMKECERLIWNSKLPVLVIFEGTDISARKECVKSIINCLEPLTYDVVLNELTDKKEAVFLQKYWENIPAKSRLVIYEESFYRDVFLDRLSGRISKGKSNSNVRSINIFERQLSDDGYLIVKIFLHQSKNTVQKKLLNNEYNDKSLPSKKFLHRYDDFVEIADDILDSTSTQNAPWHIVSTADKNCCKVKVLQILVRSIKSCLDCYSEKYGGVVTAQSENYKFEMVKTPLLKDVSPQMQIDNYKQEIACQQKKFALFQQRMINEKVSLVIAFEGWDASGKGGSIKRIIQPLDPDIYRVVPISAPTSEEISRHYLWRFYKNLPTKGHITVFDRSWYGRVLVERVEEITSIRRWTQAYREINEFERELHDNNVIIVKFWMHIDRDEQLMRFHVRQTDPEKQWKIKPDDWRNRDKWDKYEIAVNEMTAKTSTSFAPWHIIGANDKKYARVKTLKIINKTLKDYFDGRI